MPNVTGITIYEASKILKELGLKVDIDNNNEEEDKEKIVVKKSVNLLYKI